MRPSATRDLLTRSDDPIVPGGVRGLWQAGATA